MSGRGSLSETMIQEESFFPESVVQSGRRTPKVKEKLGVADRYSTIHGCVVPDAVAVVVVAVVCFNPSTSAESSRAIRVKVRHSHTHQKFSSARGRKWSLVCVWCGYNEGWVAKKDKIHSKAARSTACNRQKPILRMGSS